MVVRDFLGKQRKWFWKDLPSGRAATTKLTVKDKLLETEHRAGHALSMAMGKFNHFDYPGNKIQRK